MIKVYCYSKCTTCKKALKWLDDKGIAYDLADIKTDHPNEEMLLFSTSVGVLSVIGILSFVAGIAMIVGYILYLVHLNRAKNMLAE